MSTKEIKKFLKFIFSVDGMMQEGKEKIEDLHFNFFLGICINGVIILVGSIFNIIGIKELNIWLGLIINFIALFVASRPKIITTVGATGALLPDNKPAVEGLIDTGKLYARFVVHVLLFCSSFMLFLGIVSIRNNPNIVAVILFCGLITVWIDIVWGVKTRIFEKATYALIVIAVITNFLALPSRATYLRWIGFYPFEWISTSETDEKISEIEKFIFEQDQEKDILILDMILEKIKSGKPLSKYESIIYENLKSKRKTGIIPNAVSGAFEKVSDIASNAIEMANLKVEIERLKAAMKETQKSTPTITTQAPSAISKKHYIIPLKPGEIMDVDKIRKGEEWRYLAADESFSHRIKKSSRTCWEVVRSTEICFAEWSGTLQVKNISNRDIEIQCLLL